MDPHLHTQTHRHTDTQTPHRHTDTQTPHRHTDTTQTDTLFSQPHLFVGRAFFGESEQRVKKSAPPPRFPFFFWPFVSSLLAFRSNRWSNGSESLNWSPRGMTRRVYFEINCQQHHELQQPHGATFPIGNAAVQQRKAHGNQTTQTALSCFPFSFLLFFLSFFFFHSEPTTKSKRLATTTTSTLRGKHPSCPSPKQHQAHAASRTHRGKEREREREQRGKHQTHKPKAPRTNKHQASSSSLLLLHKTKTLRDQRRELVRDNPAETNRAEQRQQVFLFLSFDGRVSISRTTRVERRVLEQRLWTL